MKRAIFAYLIIWLSTLIFCKALWWHVSYSTLNWLSSLAVHLEMVSSPRTSLLLRKTAVTNITETISMVVLSSVTVDSEMMKNWDPEVSNHILFWWKLLRTVGNVWRQKLSQNFRAMHASCPLGGFWANVMPFWLDKALFDREKIWSILASPLLVPLLWKIAHSDILEVVNWVNAKSFIFCGSLILGKLFPNWWINYTFFNVHENVSFSSPRIFTFDFYWLCLNANKSN